MSECIDEVFSQESGLVCRKTIENEKLKAENKILKDALEVIRDYATDIDVTATEQSHRKTARKALEKILRK